MLKSKIHRATVTHARLDYEGSITIDQDLMDAADLLPNELVAIYNINNGERFETYVIPGIRGAGDIGLNGAAAHKVHVGDLVIIASYVPMATEAARNHEPRLIFVDEDNHAKEKPTEKVGSYIRLVPKPTSIHLCD